MEDYSFNVNEENNEKQVIEQGGLSSTEEGFMQGYMTDEEIQECSECGSALNGGSLRKEIDGEELEFCSESCAEEYEESL